MDTSSYIALSRQTTVQNQLDMIANNLANENTPGFKEDEMIFHEFLMHPKLGKQLSFVQNSGHAINFQQGGLNTTHNPLDVAIKGKGFFVVRTAVGTRYTRDGHFVISGNGLLTTSEGLPVLSTDGNVIEIPANKRNIRIATDGTISVSGDNSEPPTVLSALSVVTFEQPENLIKEGTNLYLTVDQEPLDAPEKVIVQGALEKSNVKPIMALNDMVSMTHISQTVIGFILLEHQLQNAAIQKINNDNR